jgi:hypothetical protein
MRLSAMRCLRKRITHDWAMSASSTQFTCLLRMPTWRASCCSTGSSVLLPRPTPHLRACSSFGFFAFMSRTRMPCRPRMRPPSTWYAYFRLNRSGEWSSTASICPSAARSRTLSRPGRRSVAPVWRKEYVSGRSENGLVRNLPVRLLSQRLMGVTVRRRLTPRRKRLMRAKLFAQGYGNQGEKCAGLSKHLLSVSRRCRQARHRYGYVRSGSVLTCRSVVRRYRALIVRSGS